MDSAETLRLLQQAATAAAAGRRCALATVVAVNGSAYRHEGARMLVFEDRTVGGGAISGGCLESDVVEAARRVIETGQPLLLRYDMTAGEDDLWGLGTGCNGAVEVFIQPVLTLAGPVPGAARQA
ncbi:MAG: XdhC family protein [Bacillota bacterium]